ncbi:alpha/beta hydrolase [Natronoglycomyces albus]|uniref:DUF1023 domain-containing protein n=1 Tax=Natronoglycomyces albus TaxID=2811108 RepID=A0A895XV15_9ACTN|nr:alpha/beta hydrolase [Natronoglycomyces albus]QSB05488.1 hypothetical protein JQS30_00645 [Natronoglycomyces albus]
MTSLDYAYAKDLSVESIREAAERWYKLARHNCDTGDELRQFAMRKIGPDVFDGGTATAARARAQQLAGRFDDAAEEAELISRTLHNACDDLDVCALELRSVVDAAENCGYLVGADGSVRFNTAAYAEAAIPPEVHDGAQSWARQIEAILDRMREIDEGTDRTLRTLIEEGTRSQFDADRVSSALFDHVLSGNATTDEVYQWWTSLPQDMRDEILRDDPDMVAWLDGIPSVDRHTANMRVLQEHVLNNPNDVDAAALLSDMANSDNLLLGFRPAEYETRTIGHGGGLIGTTEANIRVSDWQVIVATGDPDQADNVATFVPGTDSDRQWGSVDEGTKLQIERAKNLADEAQLYAPDQSTVAVMWLAYDAPNGVLAQAPDPQRARDGAADLNRFIDGMGSVNQGDNVRQTVLGHSYGSLTVAYGDQSGGATSADAIVVAGSPGFNDAVDSARDFNVGAENFYYLEAEGDMVPSTPVHGSNPGSPLFPGGTELTTSTSGHSEYYQRRTDDIMAMAAVIVGDVGAEHIENDHNAGRAYPDLGPRVP